MNQLERLIDRCRREVAFDYVRSAGPGGQNVNKVSTAVQLRFDVRNSAHLTSDTKSRLMRLAGKRFTADGILVIEARRRRTQNQNRDEALRRLASLLEHAAEKPRQRRKSRPSAASKEKRLRSKRHRAEIKQMRRTTADT